MKVRYILLSGLAPLVFLGGCTSFDRVIETGSNDRPQHNIQVVEDTIVLEVPMNGAEPGIPYYQRRKVEAFLADYKSRGFRHGPLILSVPTNSPWASQLEVSAQQAYDLAYDYGVLDLKRSDYASNGSGDAPLVLAFTAYRAIAPNCPTLNRIDLASSRTNDPQPRFGCALQANLAAMVADPADLIGARASDPSDVLRRATVLDKYRAGQSTITARDESESGAISDAID